MRNFLNPSDRIRIGHDVRDLDDVFNEPHLLYVVSEAVVESSGNPIDSVFGEPVDPFAIDEQPTTTRNYVPFLGYLITNDQQSEYNEGGFDNKRRVTVVVNETTVYNQSIAWAAGLLVLWNSEDYRVTDVDDRGFIYGNRKVIRLEQVT